MTHNDDLEGLPDMDMPPFSVAASMTIAGCRVEARACLHTSLTHARTMFVGLCRRDEGHVASMASAMIRRVWMSWFHPFMEAVFRDVPDDDIRRQLPALPVRVVQSCRRLASNMMGGYEDDDEVLSRVSQAVVAVLQRDVEGEIGRAHV